MFKQYVALARAQYERWNAEDFDAWIDGFDPSVQYFSSVSASLDGQGEFRGHEEMRTFVKGYFEAWEWFRLWPIEFIDAGAQLAAVCATKGRGRESGAEVEGRVAHVWSFRGGRATRCLSFQTRDQALEAAGVPRQAMSQENVDLVMAFFDAYNARDSDAVDRLLDPDAEITTLSARAGLPFRWSPGATRQYFEALDEAWADLRIEIEDYRELGKRVVALGLVRGVGRSSQIEVASDFAVVFVVRNARLVLVATYDSWNEALKAAGLSE